MLKQQSNAQLALKNVQLYINKPVSGLISKDGYPKPKSTQHIVADQLWLHVHLPQLPLDILTRGSDGRKACVLCDDYQGSGHQGSGHQGSGHQGSGHQGSGHKSRRKITRMNGEAARLGVRVGMPLNAAHILGDITVLQRNEDLEKKAISRLCTWAMQFSPVVCGVSSDGLLIEIKGSLKLFGGVAPLLSQVRKGLKDLGYKSYIAIAPTPLGATALARAEQQKVITASEELQGVLSHLPLEVLRLPAEQRNALESIGARAIGDCLRLPRGGLGRRSSPKLLALFDRLTGQHPDPRPHFVAPKLFQSHIDLPWETRKAQTLSLAGERLLQELVGYLRGMAGMTRCLRWSLQHADNTLTHFQLELAKPSRDLAYFAMLFREKIARLEIEKDIKEVALYVDEIDQTNNVIHADLFDSGRENKDKEDEDWASFIDRLRTRLGDNAVKRLKAITDHRPECAWRWQRPVSTQPPMITKNARVAGDVGAKNVIGIAPNSGMDTHRPGSKMPERPVWLMRRPVRIQHHNGNLDINGPLKLLAERERIETGWWDGKPVGRDYFVAANPAGAKLWIYRELSGNRDWFLHGIFD